MWVICPIGSRWSPARVGESVGGHGKAREQAGEKGGTRHERAGARLGRLTVTMRRLVSPRSLDIADDAHEPSSATTPSPAKTEVPITIADCGGERGGGAITRRGERAERERARIQPAQAEWRRVCVSVAPPSAAPPHQPPPRFWRGASRSARTIAARA